MTRRTSSATTSTVAVVLAVLALGAGCGAESSATGSGKGIVYGDVTAGPSCPVADSTTTDCADAPVSGSVEFWQGDQLKASAIIHHDGTFTADVALGRYTVKVATGAQLPACQDQAIEVTDSAAVELHIACDSGIR